PEIELALQLRRYAMGFEGKKQLAVEAVADALETIPMILAETSGLDALEALMKLRQLHSEGKVQAGINALSGEVVESTFDANIIEPIIVKKQAIKSAIEAAVTILKIDDVIAAQPPKKEKGGKGEEGSTPKMPEGMPEF
ncbi:MAG: thermosome subunit, partial [Desulfurococcales archaeon]|nr:thermosome subunit [Desulfurococcales archaeon]